MKTKTVTLKLELPASEQELLRGLEDLRSDTGLVHAQQRVTAAQQTLEQAKAELQRLDAEARRLPDAITSGHAAPSQLDAALIAVRRAAAVVPAAEQALVAAEAEHARATEAAKERALQLVNERFAQLLKADEIVVAQMNAIDAMMDCLTWRLHKLCFDPATGGSGRYDQRGRTGELPERAQVMMRTARPAV